MTAAENKLAVFAHLDGAWAPCGLLSMTEEAETVLASSFAYGLRYLERHGAIEIDPVSLSLQDKEAVRGRALYPGGGLNLFGGIRDAAPDAWGRRVIEAKLKVPANSLPESTYLLHGGSDRVGALDVRQALTDAPQAGYNDWNSLQYLIEGAERIEEGLPVPANLEVIFRGGSALGGARPKASVRDEQGVLWLAKFSSRNDYFNMPIVEAATLQLAAACGLTVPPVRVVHLASRIVVLVRRFDRYWEAPTAHGTHAVLPADFMSRQPEPGMIEKRLPFISGLTLLGCDESESPTKAYADLAHAIRRYAHADVIRHSNQELFARMIYNILVSNDDDHLRNHGFIWDPGLQGWRLSPLYDVMPRPSSAYERYLHLGIGRQGNVATLDNALSAREAFTLSEREAAQTMAQVWAEVREWRVYFDSYGVPPEEAEKVAPAFRHIDHVSSAELRRLLP